MAERLQGYDLIGDVHGCALSLQKLLEKLGYSKQGGIYRHATRKVIFLGDIVDRGPRIREALHIVRDMVDAGEARIVMGNHEYNYLCYLTPGRPGSGMPYLREHTARHRRILNETLEQFEHHPQEQAEFLRWIREMPLFLEFDDFRVVHACWHQPLIDRFLAQYPDRVLTDDFLHRSSHQGSMEWTLMDRLLRGTHLRLPNDEVMISKDGFKRRFFRTKFWSQSPLYYADVVFQPDPLPAHVARMKLTEQDREDLLHYDLDQKPLFIGHYWRDGEPAPITSNIACLDYSAVKFGKLVAYRYDGEQELRKEKFIWVDVLKEISEPN
ncbi:metallophosphoesterase [Pontibacterium granulatum]|uniref:metallophosphoesterase n=1 Tax=Pontibacterium granulatum TaxID=2036029 RepID=UPI00249B6E5E|nr:metallophosphoesterase [Pontibacterium granulatum]MDI3326841.1 metallophosphoesterase [Pontibacterium granulatum]